MVNKFNGRKVLKAVTKHDLEQKVVESEKRDWKRVGVFSRHHYSGHWCCVVERKSKLES